MSLDGIRIARAGLLIGWLLVSTLVVAGFAAFSTSDDTVDPQQQLTLTSNVGNTAGAVAAMSFAGTLGGAEADEPTVDLDPRAPSAALTVAPTGEENDRQGGVYVRSGYLSEAEVRDLISRHFAADDVNRAIRVAWCVSSFNPAAINPVTGASGLFQHLPENWAEHSAAAERAGVSIFEPEANVAVAAWMLYELPGGWSHWNCSP